MSGAGGLGPAFAKAACAPPPLSAADVRAAPYRSDDRARDDREDPVATLAALGFRSDWRLAQIWPGDGYWVRFVAPLLAEGGGEIVAAHLDPRIEDPGVRAARAAFEARIAALPPAARASVTLSRFSRAAPAFVPAGTRDAVWVFDGLGALVRGGLIDPAARSAFAALKPGGVADIRASTGDEASIEPARAAFARAGFRIAPPADGTRPGFRAVKD